MQTSLPNHAELPAGKRVARVRALTLFLCFLIVMVDGFDVAAAGYIAPMLRWEWTLDATQLGVLFGVGLLGVTLGSFLWGPVADAIGRKRVIFISLLLFGGASLASAAAPTFTMLIALRLITGFGVGGALPNAITLSSEHSVSRHRSLLVTMMISGFPLGLAFGGGFAAWLMPRFGWQSVFVFGGVVPLLLAPVAWKWLPESLQFMAGKARFAEELKATLHRLGSAETTIAVEAATTNKAPAAALFDTQYRRGTVLLWIAFFCNLWVYYQVTSWLPTVIADSGIAPGHAAGIGSLLPVGGIVGSFFMARLMDRKNQFAVLACSYAAAAACVTMVGLSIGNSWWLHLAVFFSGVTLVGAQPCINALTANYYGNQMRATGVAWALGFGRIGSIIGAASGGMILASLHSPQLAFAFFAIPTLGASLAMVAMMRTPIRPAAPMTTLDVRADMPIRN